MTRTKTGIYGSPVKYSVSPLCFEHIWQALKLEGYHYGLYECPRPEESDSPFQANLKSSDHMGGSITMPIKLSVMPFMDEMTAEAKAVGSVNTFKLEDRADGRNRVIGTNLDIKAIQNSLREVLTGVASPFRASIPDKFEEGKAAGFVVGGGGATRAAIYALQQMQLSPVYIINRDPEETGAMIRQFPAIDLRALTSVEDTEKALSSLQASGRALCLGVGCIPSVEPQSDGEKMVYAVTETIFRWKAKTPNSCTSSERHIAIPEIPIFFDMAYKPNMTLLRCKAEELGWQTGSGVDIVAENCFEQTEFWLGLSVPAEAREKIRNIVRNQQ